jgi:sugar lactone lactonase YvrE/predicted membrane-bound mannosyltransferase
MANDTPARKRPRHADQPTTDVEGVPNVTADDTATSPRAAAVAKPAPVPNVATSTSLLDRTVSIANPVWAIVAFLGLLAAGLFRIVQLDIYALTQREAVWAYQSMAIYVGRSMPGAPDVPEVSPLFMLLETLSYFLFGVTDATARFVPALFGFGIVLLVFALRPFLSRYVVLAMILMTGLSPTLVFASRTVSPVIEICFFSLLIVVAVLRAGIATSSTRVAIWSAFIGFGIAALLATGIEGVTAFLSIAVGIGVGALTDPREESPGAFRKGVVAIASSAINGPVAGSVFIASLVILFTRFFSDLAGINGILTTFGNWGRLMGTQSSSTPTSIFFWSSLLYEILAVAFAIVAILVPRRMSSTGATSIYPPAFIAWFLTSLVLCSLAQGRDPEHAALVALPLVLLGGFGLGYTLERIPWSKFLATSAGLVPLALAGIFVGLISSFTIVARANDVDRQNDGAASTLVQIVFILVLLIAPLIYLVSQEFVNAQRTRYVGWSALIVLAIFLGLFTIRSTTMLAISRADEGVELLAPRTPTSGVEAMVDQTLRLSRDVSINEMNATDNTGSNGITIAIDPDARWPFAWYFRNFPNASITTAAGWNEADLVISTSSEGMAEAGYVVQTRNWLNRVPPSYDSLDAGNILSHLFQAGDWYPGIRYLLFRELPDVSEPGQVSFGYTYALSNQLNPNFGPFDLFDDVGPGSGLGQLNGPTDVALSADGETIFVLDSGNLRVERYQRDGTFIGVWDGTTDSNAAFATQFSQGPGGIFESDTGVTYVADTWNHRVVFLNENGEFASEIGQRGVATDTRNSPDPNVSPGLFYGPRGVTVYEGEIFVTDTGNERVQVFTTDGTFLRAFGGYGQEPGKLIEPVGITIGPDGNVYVADSGNGRITIFSRDGQFISNFDVPQWQNQSERVNYLEFGPDGILYATSPSTSEVLAIGNGQIAVVASDTTREEFERPMGIAIDASGTLLVVDTGRARVVEFQPEVPDELFAPGAATPVATPESATPTQSPPS